MNSREVQVLACCLGAAGETRGDVRRIAYDGEDADNDSVEGVVMVQGPEARARELLQAGVPRVFLGEAALKDASAVGRLAAEFGVARIGVYAAARRMNVNWGLDTVSNADFRFMMPSRCEPCWEILGPSGSPTGTELGWWIGEMYKLGASAALVRADVLDDGDLNLLAVLAARHGERLWFGPLDDTAPRLEDWIDLAGVRRLALPSALLERMAGVVARRADLAVAAASRQ